MLMRSLAITILGLLSVPVTTSAQVDLNFDPATPRTRTDRQLSAISLQGTTLPVLQPMMMYNDLTAYHFTVHPGELVQPHFAFTGTWMQGYIYVDFNGNGSFDVKAPGAQGSLGEGNELLCFAAMTCPDGNYNSAGEALSTLNVLQPPSFTVPDTLADGLYRMRWKVDWDDCDPAGRVDEANSIIKNGGAIIDVMMRVTHDNNDNGYELIFADEFDLSDNSRPNPEYWTSSVRRGSVWNRWISDSPDVTFIRDGHLVCRAIPNPDQSSDDVPMITGSVETRDKFSFTYGKVEVSLCTTPHAGNFPAAWMMPQPPCEIWPNAGEIDIFEAIDAQNKAYHTIHSHWTHDLGNKNDPASSFTSNVNPGQWHVYGVDWTPDYIMWTLDRKVVATYLRSNDPEKLEAGQWPFDHDFYLILNQSVGDGSWAKAADTSFTYETQFDWIRVYQLKSSSDGIHPTYLHSGQNLHDNRIHDLSGRTVTRPLRPGIYIRNGRKYVIR